MATYKSHQHTIVTIVAQSTDKVVITSTQASPVSNARNIWFGIRREMVSCYSSGQSRLVSCIHIFTPKCGKTHVGNMRWSSMSVFCFSLVSSAVRCWTNSSRLSAYFSSFCIMLSIMPNFLQCTTCIRLRVEVSLSTKIIYMYTEQGLLGSRVVSALDSGAVGPGFKSQSQHCLVTVLGKLFTPIVPMFTKQRNW